MGSRTPLVLFIDDVQWGDVDSAPILTEWLRRPDAPAALIILCYRDSESGQPALLREVTSALESAADAPTPIDVPLAPLDPETSRALAEALLGRAAAHESDLAATIARESGGNAFFIDELAERVREQALAAIPFDEGVQFGVSLELLIRERIASIDVASRGLLEVIMLSGRPLDRRIAVAAAGLRSEASLALATLDRANLVIATADHDGNEAIEPYHDRIRETVTTMLGDDQRRACHRRLAEALEGSDGDHSESLALHWKNAGENARAAAHASRAADRAAQALAFDHAASLYRMAIELDCAGAPCSGLHLKLGTALSNAGRSEEAARVFLAAAGTGETDAALELVRRGAEQLLYGGYVAEGRATIERLLRRVGMDLPVDPRRVLPILLARRVLIFARGYCFAARPESAIASYDLLRVDAHLTATQGLAWINPVLGTALNARSLLLALDVGEPHRVARALAGELGYLGFFRQGRGQREFDRLFARLMTMAEELGDPRIRGDAEVHAALSRFNWGRWRDGLALSDSAERILRTECQGVSWERVNAELCLLNCLLYLGELRELGRRYRSFFGRAVERGDQHAETYLRLRIGWYVALAADQPAEARRRIIRGARCEDDHIGSFMSVVATAELDTYEGRPADAVAHLTRHWDSFERRSTLLRVPILMIEIRFARARASIAAAALGGAGGMRQLEAAERDAQRMSRTDMPWALAAATSVRAGIAAVRGEKDKSLRHLAEAEVMFLACDSPMHAEAVRFRRGAFEAGLAGRRRADEAKAALESRGVSNVERFCRYLVPGTDCNGTACN
jgi:eukaryotic-like serine/threonine-protein kinase